MIMRQSIQELAAEPEVAAALSVVPREQPLPPRDRASRLTKDLAQLQRRLDELKDDVEKSFSHSSQFQRALAIAAEVVGGSEDDLLCLRGRSRTARICALRAVFFRRAHAEGLPLHVIARAVNRDPATVLYALRTRP